MNRQTLSLVGLAILIVAVGIWALINSGRNNGRTVESPTVAGTASSNSQQWPTTGTAAIPTGPLQVENSSPAPNIAPIQPTPAPVAVQATVFGKKEHYSPKFFSARSERMAVPLNPTPPIHLARPQDTSQSARFVQ